jgi:hypothetical protein
MAYLAQSLNLALLTTARRAINSLLSLSQIRRKIHRMRAIALFALLMPSVALAQSSPMMGNHGMTGSIPAQPGQSAFAAIQEIVGILEADPKTDWTKVNIEALRQHLIDMNNVTLSATVTSEPVEGGMRYRVTGVGPVQDSIRRMVMAHAASMDGVNGWRFEAATIDEGATLTVRAPASDMAKIRGLGFIGIMTRGMHHQMHHLMLARGENPHR